MRSPTCEAGSELPGGNLFVAGADDIVGRRYGEPATGSADLRRNSTVSSRNLRFLSADGFDKLVTAPCAGGGRSSSKTGFRQDCRGRLVACPQEMEDVNLPALSEDHPG